MLKTGVVHVSWQGSDISFVIDADAPFEQLTGELKEYLAEKGNLFSKGDISINAGKRMFSGDELAEIRRIIECNSGLKVTRFWCTPDSLDGGTFHLETKSQLPDTPPAPPLPTIQTNEKSDGGVAPLVERVVEGLKIGRGAPSADSFSRNQSRALFIKVTFRSGETVQHDGDVVVLGDVNPGAEIRADGDIVVLGALKGLVHAGASGDARAAIIALDLDSPRIQIGSYEGLASPKGRKDPTFSAPGPKIAYVRRRSIHVAPFTGRFARYTKGVPYDG